MICGCERAPQVAPRADRLHAQALDPPDGVEHGLLTVVAHVVVGQVEHVDARTAAQAGQSGGRAAEVELLGEGGAPLRDRGLQVPEGDVRLSQRRAHALPGPGGPVGRDGVAGYVAQVDVAHRGEPQRADGHAHRGRRGRPGNPRAYRDRPRPPDHPALEAKVPVGAGLGAPGLAPGAALGAGLENQRAGVRGVAAGEHDSPTGRHRPAGGLDLEGCLAAAAAGVSEETRKASTPTAEPSASSADTRSPRGTDRAGWGVSRRTLISPGCGCGSGCGGLSGAVRPPPRPAAVWGPMPEGRSLVS